MQIPDSTKGFLRGSDSGLHINLVKALLPSSNAKLKRTFEKDKYEDAKFGRRT